MSRTSQNAKLSTALRLLDQAVAEKKDEIRELVTEEFESIKESVGEIPSVVAGMANDAKDMAVEKAKEVTRSVDRQARREPWKFIATAAAGSLILGWFLGRRR